MQKYTVYFVLLCNCSVVSVVCKKMKITKKKEKKRKKYTVI